MRLYPNKNTASRVRVVLDGLVKAHVRLDRFCVRVLITTNRDDADLAARELLNSGYRSATGGDLRIEGGPDRFWFNCYRFSRQTNSIVNRI